MFCSPSLHYHSFSLFSFAFQLSRIFLIPVSTILSSFHFFFLLFFACFRVLISDCLQALLFFLFCLPSSVALSFHFLLRVLFIFLNVFFVGVFFFLFLLPLFHLRFSFYPFLKIIFFISFSLTFPVSFLLFVRSLAFSISFFFS